MALIKCPECGQEVSDKSAMCPRCGFPIASASPSGKVRIKVSSVKRGPMFGGKQRVTILLKNGNTPLWEGQVDEIAEIHFDGPTAVTVKYHLSAHYYGGECEGIIDPSVSKKYNVSVRQGMFKVIPTLQAVDMIDSD